MAITELKPYLSNIADAIKEKTHFPNLFDKDNVNVMTTGAVPEWGTTETGLYFITDGIQNCINFSLGPAIDFARKTVTLSYEPSDERNIYAYMYNAEPTTGESWGNWCESSYNKNDKTAVCRYFPYAGGDYENYHLGIRINATSLPKGTRVEINNIMVTLSPTPMSYRPYGAEPDKINAQNFVNKISEVYDAGKKSEYDRFWDEFQAVGERANYKYAFYGSGWTDDTYKPKYPIVIGPTHQCNYMFSSSKISKVTGVDFTNAGNLQYLFYGCSSLTYVGVINTKGVESTSDMTHLFNSCQKLKTIEKLILNTSGNRAFNGCFNMCTALENITIEGVVGNNIDFRYSPLSKDSIMGKVITAEEYSILSDAVKTNNVFIFNGNYYYGGIVTALKSDASSKTLTLKKSAVNEAFEINVDDETTYPVGSEFYELRHSKDNWTFSYV